MISVSSPNLGCLLAKPRLCSSLLGAEPSLEDCILGAEPLGGRRKFYESTLSALILGKDELFF